MLTNASVMIRARMQDESIVRSDAGRSALVCVRAFEPGKAGLQGSFGPLRMKGAGIEGYRVFPSRKLRRLVSDFSTNSGEMGVFKKRKIGV